MRYQYIPYTGFLFASTFVSISLGIYAIVRRRNAKGAVSFILNIAAVTIWSLGNALEMSGANFTTKLFWANMQYFAYCYLPVTLLAMCMQYTGHDKWVRNKKIWWLALFPTIIILLVWTDTLHGLIRYNMHLDFSGQFPVISKEFGPIFYLHAVYSHFLNIFAWAMLIRSIFSKTTVYRKQAPALFIGVSMIVIPNLVYVLGLSPIKRLDITPLFFVPAGLLMAWGIFRYKMFDLVPLARATVIEMMNAGVLVMDLQNRVLDINPAFEKIIGSPASEISTRNVESVCRKIPELAKACVDRSITRAEFSIVVDELPKVYEVLFSPLTDSGKDVLIGRLAVIHEITELKQAQERYLKQQWKLAVIEERERMARDLHDNLGQVLGFINLQAQGIRQELAMAGVETGLHEIDQLVDVTQTAHGEIREYIRNTRNSIFVARDFITVLKDDIMRFEEQTGIHVQLDMPPEFTADEYAPNVLFNILYIAKEALNNIRKHSHANIVRMVFSVCSGSMCLVVEDDGKGFDTERYEEDKIKTFGLNIMRERASEIGAEIDIRSVIGEGSRIILRIPTMEGE